MILSLYTKPLNCYRSIDTLPVYNWHAVIENDDVTYLLKNRDNKPTQKQLTELQTLWLAINDQYVARFGFSDDYKAIFRKRKEIAVRQVKLITNEDRSEITFIKIVELEIEKLTKGMESNEHYLKTIARVEKALGIKIDEMTCSVAKYVNYCQLCSEKPKPQKQDTPLR